MKILLTGSTSFTGMWFAKTLAEAGHEVIATLQKKKTDYKDLKLKRLEVLEKLPIRFVEECSFGDEKFITIIKNGIDSLNHHGANVENYKSLDFDVLKATADNTRNIREVIQACNDHSTQQIVLTGSVFEQDEGIGTEPLEAFSPYGLSKGITYQIFRFWAKQYGIKLKKFVIANPYGPYEEPRFCSYLIEKIRNNEPIDIGTPDYIRDNIYIGQLSGSYCEFTTDLNINLEKLTPSGLIGSQGRFATIYTRNMANKFNTNPDINYNHGHTMNEPEVRIGIDKINNSNINQNEWSEIFNFYKNN